MFFKHLASLPRRSVLTVLTAVVVVNVVIVSYFQFFDLIVDVQILLFLSRTEFKKSAAALFLKITSDKDRYWLADSSLCHVDAEIPANRVVVPEGDAGPEELFYDPRFTLAVYLDELTRLGESTELPTLPFHWTDWVDVTSIHESNSVPENKRITCRKLGLRSRNHPNPSAFCKSRDQYNDEELRELGFRNRNSLPFAVVHDHSKHEDLCYNDLRKFMAKSYTMTHLPKPFKVIILNGGDEGGTYEFMVDQTKNPEQRLIHSGLVGRYLMLVKKKSTTKVLQEGGTFTVNHLAAYENLLRTVSPRHLSAEDDKMYAIVKSPAGSNKDIPLTKDEFDYPKSKIDDLIAEYEAMEYRDIMAENFLEGLRECQRTDGTNEPTYFKMATLDIRESRNQDNDWGWHYDWRFFNDALFYRKAEWSMEERVERTNIILERLLRNWNRFAEEKGIVSWIMHGPLLAWYWDGLMFPYDVDIDIQMTAAELARLSRHYNQTLVVEDPTEGYGRYLIDCGSYIHNRDESHTGNHIDARFVDIDTGIYIDITSLAKSNFNLPDEYKKDPIVHKDDGDANAEVYNDRRKHFYTLDQLQPLHYSMMGGVPLYVPNQIEERLRFEYSKGLDSPEFKDWYFVPKLQLWVMKRKLMEIFTKEDYSNDKGDFDMRKMIDLVAEMTDAQGLALLKDDEILREYYLTNKFTEWHMVEKTFLFDNEGKDNFTALNDPHIRRRYNTFVGTAHMGKPLRKCLYEYEVFDRINNH